MQTIQVNTKSRPSTVFCGAGAAKQLNYILDGKDVFVVTDENVYGLYKDFIAENFGGAPVCVLPAGERHKNRNSLFMILDKMLQARLRRNSTLVALGGGVVGDMGGLAASLYMRGIRAVQVPTTLLAQVDSSVGGKTAIDHRGVKNVIGTFYQPEYVVCDPLFLRTLPQRELKCGLGEIIKTGALDAEILDKLERNTERLFDLSFMEEITADCVRFKAAIVVTADDQGAAIGAISASVAEMHLEITSINGRYDKNGSAIVDVTVSLTNRQDVEVLIKKIMGHQKIIDVRRAS